jgi:hypothetical protein
MVVVLTGWMHCEVFWEAQAPLNNPENIYIGFGKSTGILYIALQLDSTTVTLVFLTSLQETAGRNTKCTLLLRISICLSAKMYRQCQVH